MDGTATTWAPLDTARGEILPRLETLHRMAESLDEPVRSSSFVASGLSGVLAREDKSVH